METAKRLIHLDLIKILAIFLVIFNHTSERGFSLFASWPRGSVRYFTYLVPSVFCKVAIFLFFMVSGALLLNRDYSLRDIWTKKIPRIAGALLLVSVLTFVWREHGNFSEGLLPMLRHFFAGLYTGGIDAIFWFLYAYLAFLMALPVLRAIVKAVPAAGYQYIILLYLAFECIGALEYLLFRGGHTLSHYLIPSFLFQYIFFYPLMGYYLERVLPSEAVNGKKLALLNAGGLLTILAGHQHLYAVPHLYSLRRGLSGLPRPADGAPAGQADVPIPRGSRFLRLRHLPVPHLFPLYRTVCRHSDVPAVLGPLQ